MLTFSGGQAHEAQKAKPQAQKQTQKKKQISTKTKKDKVVKKKISTKYNVTIPSKIYNANFVPVKTTNKMQKKNLFKSKVRST